LGLIQRATEENLNLKYIALTVLLACLPLQTPRPSECGLAKGAERTYWGHMNTVLEYADPVSYIRGIALAAGSENTPVEGALVELFDHPEIALKTHGSQVRTGQKRLAVCITGKDGRFSFDPLTGKYELRLSKPDCNTESLILRIRKEARNRGRIEIRIEAGT
jgi:hypothetical protein